MKAARCAPAAPALRLLPPSSPGPHASVHHGCSLARWWPSAGRRVLALAGPRYAARVLALAACPSRVSIAPLAPQTARGAGALATHLPAITRGLPGAPHTAPPAPGACAPSLGLARPGGPLLGRVAAAVVCAPAGLWSSVAGTARAARARSRLVRLAVSRVPSGG